MPLNIFNPVSTTTTIYLLFLVSLVSANAYCSTCRERNELLGHACRMFTAICLVVMVFNAMVMMQAERIEFEYWDQDKTIVDSHENDEDPNLVPNDKKDKMEKSVRGLRSSGVKKSEEKMENLNKTSLITKTGPANTKSMYEREEPAEIVNLPRPPANFHEDALDKQEKMLSDLHEDF
ncbi:unnamed protein product [Caenorhabditis auriculariae]|uniref:Uncharacterized protein n=1 Tax=Caenorhabditis auriculariae TaxID=2777116 RepID=A0A8S1GM86_9PELO|nr:unnamed protein product [Caenorhabditis auriculariae]